LGVQLSAECEFALGFNKLFTERNHPRAAF
jgi:hypothetical protein